MKWHRTLTRDSDLLWLVISPRKYALHRIRTTRLPSLRTRTFSSTQTGTRKRRESRQTWIGRHSAWTTSRKDTHKPNCGTPRNSSMSSTSETSKKIARIVREKEFYYLNKGRTEKDWNRDTNRDGILLSKHFYYQFNTSINSRKIKRLFSVKLISNSSSILYLF